MKKRRYMISPTQEGEFHTGRVRDGRQFILGPTFSEVVAYVFDPDGRLISRERRKWRESQASPDSMEIYWLFEPGTRSKVKRKVTDWKRELGLMETPIVVDAFFDADFDIGIEDMPKYLEVGIGHESELDRYEREMQRIDWIQSKKFIFWWELDYWMAEDGTTSGV